MIKALVVKAATALELSAAMPAVPKIFKAKSAALKPAALVPNTLSWLVDRPCTSAGVSAPMMLLEKLANAVVLKSDTWVVGKLANSAVVKPAAPTSSALICALLKPEKMLGFKLAMAAELSQPKEVPNAEI